MNKPGERQIISWFVVAIVFAVAAKIGFNWYHHEHAVFDSQKWKTDVASRFDMPEPVHPGNEEKRSS